MRQGESGGLDDDYVGVDVLLDILERGLKGSGQGAADASVRKLDRVISLSLEGGSVYSDLSGFVDEESGLLAAFGVHRGDFHQKGGLPAAQESSQYVDIHEGG